MNSAPPLADFDSKWLLLAETGTIVHLWKVKDRVGYIDRSSGESSRWVFLDEETLSKIQPCEDDGEAGGIRPDFQLN